MSVALELEGCNPVHCVIADLKRGAAVLVPTAQVEPVAASRLSCGDQGYLVYSEGAAVFAVRGAALTTPQSHPLIGFDLAEQAAA